MEPKKSLIAFMIISNVCLFGANGADTRFKIPTMPSKPTVPTVSNVEKPQIPSVEKTTQNELPAIDTLKPQLPSSPQKPSYGNGILDDKIPHFGNFPDFPKDKGDIFTLNNGKAVKLFWVDMEDDETGWNIYKDDKLINTLSPDSTKYIDSDIVDGEKYQYKIVPVFGDREGEAIISEIDIFDKSNNTQEYLSKAKEILLNQKATDEDIKKWSEELKKGKSIIQIIEDMTKQKEFLPTYNNDEEFIKTIYTALFGKEIDQSTFDDIYKKISSMEISKAELPYYLANSKEFGKIADQNGIEAIDPDNLKAQESIEKLTDFVKRMYTKALGRNAKKGGMNYWTEELLAGRKSAQQVANSFFNSKEFTDKQLSDKDFLDRVYQTIMGRKPDQSGYDYWLGELADGSIDRQKLIDSFIYSPEFQKLAQDYGIREAG